MKLEFHPRRAWRALWSPRLADGAPDRTRDLKAAYVAHVEALKATLPHARAMEEAIGGGYDAFGPVLVGVLRACGLEPGHHVVDVGCGSGRLAKPLADYLTGTYLGIDLVPDLVAYAAHVAGRPDWRFEVIDHIGIPEADGRADMVCFFSVLTHLLHEQSFWYLEEAKRVLKPGGRIVFSFLEFAEDGHMPIFWSTLAGAKANSGAPLNVFIERNVIHRWADALGLELLAIHGGNEQVAAQGNLGQALCVLRKPL